MKERSVTTSWDDGHVLDMRLATLLKKYGIAATFYISPKDREISSIDRLTNEQIRELSQDFEIGAHTMTHPDLRALDAAEAQKEIVESKKYLENVIQKPIVSFCYPSGLHSPRESVLVQQAGFKLARTVIRFATTIGPDPFALPTTLHAYDHWLDAWRIAVFARFNPFAFIRYYRHWDVLAKAMFDRVSKTGGIFHLWGHSWEIEKSNNWDRLEEVFMYIGQKSTVQYLPNGQLI
jgi:peptidoglycan/xylan/chitin deacetylase (PgdA/CDA1 family)